MKIFANHAHVFHPEIKPEGSLDALKRLMDFNGIEKTVAFAPFAGNGSTQILNPDENQNLWLASELKGQTDIVGFGTVNFDKDNLEDQVSEISDLGFSGIKIHPQFQNIRINGKKAYRVYKKAEELGLFLSFHTGVHYNRLRDSSLLMFDDLTWDFPNLKFSMEHIGGWCFFHEAVAVMTNRRDNKHDPHIFGGWTSIFWRGNWYLSQEQLLDLLAFTGDKCHIFGLDFPYKTPAMIDHAIRSVKALPVSDETKSLILGGNLQRELSL